MALLLGVQEYPGLNADRQLSGCRADVQAMRSLLIERFGFAPADVVSLLDRQATSTGIRQAMQQLIVRVQSRPRRSGPAQVVFYFSGHGSQTPDQEEGHPDCDEEDGLDETLVCYDARQEGGEADIRDDELQTFLVNLCAGDRARVWVVLDCCHSGTATRGVSRIRRLDRHVSPTLPRSGKARQITPKPLPPTAVMLAACGAAEVEPEYSQQDQTYGLLTWALVGLLRQRANVSTLSYQMLREAILDRQQREGILPAPTPQLEGSPEAVRSIVLGAGQALDRSPLVRGECLATDRAHVRLKAGSIQGVTVGSLYQLYDREDEIEARAAGRASSAASPEIWLEIERVAGLTALGRAFRWTDSAQGERLPTDLPPGCRGGLAVERYHCHGDLGVRLRVVRAVDSARDGPALGPRDKDLPPAIRQALESAKGSGESNWLVWAQGETPCDLLLRIDGDYAALMPAIGMIGRAAASVARGLTVPDSLRGGWGPVDLRDPQASSQLVDWLRRIVRARSLIRAAAQAADSRPPIGLELLRVKLNERLVIEEAASWPMGQDGTIQVRKDSLFAFRVRSGSPSGKAVYVSVLAVDPDMAIQAVFPVQGGIGAGDDQRLDPGAERVSPAYRCTEPCGPHWLIALATPQANELYLLAQPGLSRVRGAASGSPFEQWLTEQTTLRTRGTRPRPRPVDDEGWSTAVLRWDAAP